MAMDVVDYEIKGAEMQFVEVELDPGEAAIGEAGSMMFMDAGIGMDSVGEALAGIEGVAIASRAQLLGTYDVSYEGASFLVRVSAVDADAYVSAVDPRGLQATGAAPTKLLAALKAKLGG